VIAHPLQLLIENLPWIYLVYCQCSIFILHMSLIKLWIVSVVTMLCIICEKFEYFPICPRKHRNPIIWSWIWTCQSSMTDDNTHQLHIYFSFLGRNHLLIIDWHLLFLWNFPKIQLSVTGCWLVSKHTNKVCYSMFYWSTYYLILKKYYFIIMRNWEKLREFSIN
jgi:hypothetical protein